jgi:hypothetical protein
MAGMAMEASRGGLTCMATSSHECFGRVGTKPAPVTSTIVRSSMDTRKQAVRRRSTSNKQ